MLFPFLYGKTCYCVIKKAKQTKGTKTYAEDMTMKNQYIKAGGNTVKFCASLWMHTHCDLLTLQNCLLKLSIRSVAPSFDQDRHHERQRHECLCRIVRTVYMVN